MQGICHKISYNSGTGLIGIIRDWKSKGLKIVFTNGCFDLIHRGHVSYLEEAAALGDRLVVGLNSDASVRRLKGEGRPIMDERSRAYILSRLEMVDMVWVFEEDTPIELIRLIMPEVLVKGGDWHPEEIVGAELVRSHGGTVRSLSFVEGESSSSILQRIRRLP